MKAAYIKPTIKISHIKAQETFLAASGEEPTTKTLQIFDTPKDNSSSLAKQRNTIMWDDEEE